MAQYNILYIIWSLGLGGAERVVINLAKYADRDKFNPVICCLNDKGVFANEAESAGIRVIALNKKPGLDFGIIPKIVKAIKENNIHIVNTHLWGANFWGRIAAVKAGVPVIIATEHNEDIWKNILHFSLDKLLSFWTDRIIAVSDGVKQFYQKKAGINYGKIEVIRNGIDIEKYQNAVDKKDEFAITENQVTVGIIGRLVPQKGHSFLLSAVKELSPEYDIKTLIIGSGPEEERLKQLSDKMGLNGSVIFTGLRKDIPELLKTIDILVMPSLREGLPIIALEAMSAGTPIIASRVGGIPELIRHKDTGMLVEAKDIPALKSAIIELAQDKKLRQQLSLNAKKLIEEEFSISNMLNKAEGLFQQIYVQKTK